MVRVNLAAEGRHGTYQALGDQALGDQGGGGDGGGGDGGPGQGGAQAVRGGCGLALGQGSDHRCLLLAFHVRRGAFGCKRGGVGAWE